MRLLRCIYLPSSTYDLLLLEEILTDPTQHVGSTKLLVLVNKKTEIPLRTNLLIILTHVQVNIAALLPK